MFFKKKQLCVSVWVDCSGPVGYSVSHCRNRGFWDQMFFHTKIEKIPLCRTLQAREKLIFSLPAHFQWGFEGIFCMEKHSVIWSDCDLELLGNSLPMELCIASRRCYKEILFNWIGGGGEDKDQEEEEEIIILLLPAWAYGMMSGLQVPYKQMAQRSLTECYSLQIINFFPLAASLRVLLMVYPYYPLCAFWKKIIMALIMCFQLPLTVGSWLLKINLCKQTISLSDIGHCGHSLALRGHRVLFLTPQPIPRGVIAGFLMQDYDLLVWLMGGDKGKESNKLLRAFCAQISPLYQSPTHPQSSTSIYILMVWLETHITAWWT